jgi:CRISPR-associated endonuclease Cas2
MQTYLIAYDISHNNLRLKAARLLLRAGGFRVQKSVFIGTFSDARYQRLLKDLRSLETRPRWQPTDNLLLLPLHQYTRDHLVSLGQANHDWPLIYRERIVLIV